MQDELRVFKKEIGYALKSFRDRCELTIEETASKTGVATSTISRYENGTTGINIDVLDKIISGYNISMNIFFKEVTTKMQGTKE